MLQYGNSSDERQHFMGSTPHKPDVTWKYNLDAGDAGNRNPFVSYFNSGDEDSRDLRYWVTQVDANTLRLKVLETLMISPFYWGKTDYQCLFGIQHFDLSLVLTNINKVLAGSSIGIANDAGAIWPTGVIANLNVQVLDAPNQKLHITFITPQPDQEIPRLLHYPYFKVSRYSQNGQVPYLAQQTGSEVFSNITMHEIPKRCYIFGKQQPTNDATVADYYLAIDKIVMNFDNQDGRLSTLDAFDLWKLAAKNGLQRSFLAFNRVLGSVLCLEFGTDLNLNPLLCAGVRGNFQFSYTLTTRDIRENPAGGPPLPAVRYRIYTIMIPEGVLTIDDQLISISIGTITEEIVAVAPFAPSGFRHEITSYYGGGFWRNLWNGIKKAFKVGAPIVKNIAGAVGQIAPLIPHPVAQGVGMGANAVHQTLGALGAGKKRGGARLRTSSLARRL
jgi:hypothetical protein